MIKLTRRREAASLPSDFIGGKLVEKHLDLVDRYFDAVEAGKPMAFASSKWRSAKSKLKFDTHQKCAYCEAPTSTVAHGDVEHFRPKKIYWWMAYYYDNYLFSCQICNQIYKSDDFPLASGVLLAAPTMPAARPAKAAALRSLAVLLGIDASTTTDKDATKAVAGEDAALLNPYFADPEELIVYEVDDSNEEVWIRPAPGARALSFCEAATKYLGLNREELRRHRYVFYLQLAILKASFDEPALSAATKAKIAKQFEKDCDAKFPFAGMHRYFLSQWGLR